MASLSNILPVKEVNMAKWIFEPGHTEAEFRAKHMMVTWVRGLFKDIHGSIEFDPDDPSEVSFEFEIDANNLWTGDTQRDDHLRSADFLDVENNPSITFRSTGCERVGGTVYKVTGDLTIRGTTKPVVLDIDYLGRWKTPYWTDDGNAGTVTRIGFAGQTRINRHDFKVDWNDVMDKGGVVVSHEIIIRVDIEALLETELNAFGVKT
jgi:polyisoprenoid-binding protein YceI